MHIRFWVTFALFLKLPCSTYVCDPNCICDSGVMNCNNKPSAIVRIPRSIPKDCRELLLENCGIERIRKDDFRNLEQLEVLNLEGNQINDIHPQAFQNLFHLKKLLLQDNKITTIKVGYFQNLASINLINLTSNRIKIVEKHAFATLPMTRRLLILMGNEWKYCSCAKANSNQGCSRHCRSSYGTKCADAHDYHDGRLKCRVTQYNLSSYGQTRVCPDKMSACMVTIRRIKEHGQFNVTHSCANYSTCMSQMINNKNSCTSANYDTLECNFCCLGDFCKNTSIAYLTQDITFYLSFPRTMNYSRTELQTVEEYIGASIRNHVIRVSVRRNLTSPYEYGYEVNTTSVHLKSSNDLRFILKASIQKSIRYDMLAEFNINASRLDIITAVKFCQRDGSWKPTRMGESREQNCTPPFSSNLIERRIRMCNESTAGSPYWLEPDDSRCVEKEHNFMQDDPITDSNDDNTIDLVVDKVEKLLMLPSIEASSAKYALSQVNSWLTFKKDELNDLEQKYETFGRLVKAIDGLLLNVSMENGKFIFIDKSLIAAAVKYDSKYPTGVLMNETAKAPLHRNRSYVLTIGGVEDIDPYQSNTIFLPESLFQSLDGQSQEIISRVTFTAYKDDILFFDLKTSEQNSKQNVSSEVISASVPTTEITHLADPVIISFVHIQNNSRNPQCVYWSYDAKDDTWGWSSVGCAVAKTESRYTRCECHHLTHFALLMDIHPDQFIFSKTDQSALSIISYIGCVASLLALLFTILTYAMFGKLRQDFPSKLLLNLCVALFVTNLVFIAGMQEYTFKDRTACTVVAVLMHYSLLSAMSWMAVEAVNMYFSLVVVIMTETRHRLLKSMCFGWGLPLVTVLITLGSGLTNYGLLSSRICWLTNPAFYFAFLAPVAMILLTNCITFVLILHALFRVSGRNALIKPTKAKKYTRLHGAVLLVVLLGLTYMFAIFAIGEASIFFYYLFAIFNTLQGVFIFLFYCILKKDALYAWKATLKCCKQDGSLVYESFGNAQAASCNVASQESVDYSSTEYETSEKATPSLQYDEQAFTCNTETQTEYKEEFDISTTEKSTSYESSTEYENSEKATTCLQYEEDGPYKTDAQTEAMEEINSEFDTSTTKKFTS
ncbi:adhesion G-protein coupled receptor G6-like [Gigantopelta aegis]|uniref:adhesion G-protein coupled receptor G6-like n=1 Tax=Gigantopelta aegis TaxID=1735272 RepID=UPI001B88C0A4|nr:adhesion G-protein coupled receptor G6-like [Gigantopelta aegis]